MTCTICRTGCTASGVVDVTLNRGKTVIVVRNTPAEICDTCGEYYLSTPVAERVLQLVEAAVNRGGEIEVIGYAA
jgi:YgiT-type zinc finger domain-containing protein